MSRLLSERKNLMRVAHDAKTPAFLKFGSDSRRARITLVSENGADRTLPYFQLMDQQWDPDASSIKLRFIGCWVTIKGRNLLPLRAALQEDDVGLIQERHCGVFDVEDGETFIEQIEIEEMS